MMRTMRTANVTARPRETEITLHARPGWQRPGATSPPASASSTTCWTHVARARPVRPERCRPRATWTSTRTTPSRTWRSCWAQACDEALGDRAGIVRMGTAYVPMDEALAFVALDLSGRPYCVFDAAWSRSARRAAAGDAVQHFLASRSPSRRAQPACRACSTGATTTTRPRRSSRRWGGRWTRRCASTRAGGRCPLDQRNVGSGTSMIALIDYGAGNVRSVHKALAGRGSRRAVIRRRSRGRRRRPRRSCCPAWAPSATAWTGLARPAGAEPLRAVAARHTASWASAWGCRCCSKRRGAGPARRAGAVARPGGALRVRARTAGAEGPAHRLEPDCAARRALPVFRAAGRRLGLLQPRLLRRRRGRARVATTDYGGEFPSVVGRERILGIQFHPEKSQEVGLRILRNFVQHRFAEAGR